MPRYITAADLTSPYGLVWTGDTTVYHNLTVPADATTGTLTLKNGDTTIATTQVAIAPGA